MAIQKALLFLTTIFFILSSTTTTASAGDDSVAMAKLAAALHPTPSGWSTNASSAYCHWYGVACNSSGRVTKIDLSSQSLSGSLPPEISSLSGLQGLYLSNNSLSGSLPPEISSLSGLQSLDLSRNSLSGSLPHELSSLSGLQSLDLSSNFLSGSLPPELSSLSGLKKLSLSNNSLSGPLPSLANFTSLSLLYLHNNNFTSIPPGFFQGLNNLTFLYLSNNSYLTPWSFPTELTQSKSLYALDASNANMVGSLPDIFDSFFDLIALRLSYNNLSGSLPASLGNINIRYLWLDNQQIGLSGTIDVLSKMTLLSVVGLHGNQFTGMVPVSVIQLPRLLYISLTDNMLQGPFPLFPEKVEVSLEGTNNFCTNIGDPCDPQVTTLLQIAAALGYPLTLSESWKGNNACNDWPFITCNSEGRVSAINFTKQHFTGMISPAFENLTALVRLYLNDNNLTGSIPNSMTKLPQLQVLDVSNNNISGKLPVFASSVKLTTTGNPLLRIDTGPGSGATPDGSPADIGNDMDKRRDTIIIIIIIIIVVILGTTTIAICTFFSWRWMAIHRGKEKSEEMLSFDQGEAFSKFLGHNFVGGKGHKIKLKELPLLKFEEVVTSTNNFHLDNKLGQGGFGLVYKGKLQNGQEIAVKRLSRASGQGLKEFMNEVLLISKLQHKNLVRLLGCCVDREEKMLVYEYMPNKSLDAFLFDPQEQEILDWRKRMNIIEGIARGLLYLHRDSRLKIIHRDLKPSNILLDEELNPKISDFGMAKIFGGIEDQVNTKRVVGTYGYMSPEYAMQGRFSEKSDVFSFGVLLLEIVSGRRNTSFYNNEQALTLLGYAWKLWNEDNIVAIIDPLISDPCSKLEIFRCIQVGLLCVQEFTKDRPTVSNVISMFDSDIKDLPTPKQPAFTETRLALVTKSSQPRQQRCSINNVTITTMEGR